MGFGLIDQRHESEAIRRIDELDEKIDGLDRKLLRGPIRRRVVAPAHARVLSY